MLLIFFHTLSITSPLENLLLQLKRVSISIGPAISDVTTNRHTPSRIQLTGDPIMVNVFPLPVCPYANTQALYPSNALSITSKPRSENT